MMLSREQIRIIKSRIDDSSISNETLKDDVLDHLCCVVEIKVGKGENFEAALEEALHELAPKGLDEIQRQALYMQSSPKSIFMKKMMYLIGLLSAASLSLGWLFIVLGWAGGVDLFNYGFMAFLMVFIPMLTIDRYRATLQARLSEKIKIILGSVSGFIVGFSLVFKLFHLQGADIVLLVGMLLFTFGFLPFLFLNMYRKAVAGN